MSEVVTAVDVRKVYPRGEGQVKALDGVTLAVSRGEIVVVFGPSGSGKSTLLGLMGGLDYPTSGQIFLGGEDIGTISPTRLALLRRTWVGFVFQTFNLMPTLTALGNVTLPMELARMPRGQARSRARELLDLVGLSERASHSPGELSGGEQQRVAVARALANRPGLILADEPTGDLDTESGRRVMQLLAGARDHSGAACVIATHNPEFAEIADRVVRMRDGRVEEEERRAGPVMA